MPIATLVKFLWIFLISPFVEVQGVSIEQDLSMTLSQKQALDKFREQVKPLTQSAKHDYMKSDLYLIRWLRAKDFNLNAAEGMLKENLRWRAARKMDTIRNENFDDCLRDFPSTVDTYDLHGAPVGVIDIYDWDIRSAVLSGRAPRVLRYLDMLMENVTQQVFERQQKGYNATQWTVLANAENFNMINHGCAMCIPLWAQFLGSVENNYVGWMNELIVVDSPGAVQTMLEVLKPFLGRQTRDSIKILGQNRNQWQKYMDARISRSERRAPYGGTKPPAARP